MINFCFCMQKLHWWFQGQQICMLGIISSCERSLAVLFCLRGGMKAAGFTSAGPPWPCLDQVIWSCAALPSCWSWECSPTSLIWGSCWCRSGSVEVWKPWLLSSASSRWATSCCRSPPLSSWPPSGPECFAGRTCLSSSVVFCLCGSAAALSASGLLPG